MATDGVKVLGVGAYTANHPAPLLAARLGQIYPREARRRIPAVSLVLDARLALGFLDGHGHISLFSGRSKVH